MVRFGLVGTGYWAETVHAAGLAGHEAVDFVGVWGRDSAKTSVLARRYDVRAFQKPEELFESVDAVSFAVAPDVQPELAIGAAQAGCSLLLEKPTALSVEAADRLARAAAAARVRSVVFFTGRFAPPTQRWFDETILGRHWDGGSFRWIVPAAAPGSPYAGSRWRLERGALWDVAPHGLSFLLPALGPIAGVTGIGGSDGAIVLAVQHASGAVSSVSVSQAAAVRDTDTVFWGPSGVERAPARGPEHFPAAYAAAVDSLIGDEAQNLDAAFGATVVRVLAAAERALNASSGEPLSSVSLVDQLFKSLDDRA
jgi:predicted dehydrogenase